MKNLPKVSLITVYYNRCNSVKNSINSLINQTYGNLEIIIVDDFSSDNTFEELRIFEQKCSKIKLYRNEKNCGFTRTIINAINSVDAKYIAIHGSGDISFETRIEEQVRYLEEHADVGVLTPGLLSTKGDSLNERTDIEITTKDLLERNFVAHGAVMFRLSEYKKVGGYRAYFTVRQDKDLWYRMSLVTKIHYYPKILYQRFEQNNSVTGSLTSTPVPLFLSDFATFLIEERLALGCDSLDTYGDKGALFFNPTRSNNFFYHIVRVNILQRNFNVAIYYIDILIKINSNFLLLLVFKLLRKALTAIL
jgi:glycosyltransferase involved in cell wall biosynthesis